jgi:hypothetical protein
MRGGALGALGRREQAGDHPSARTSGPQRQPRVARELERVDADDRVERHVLDHLERPDAELGPQRACAAARVVDPVPDVVPTRHQLVDE